MKDICLNVVTYILTAIILMYSGWFEWKNGSKIIGGITFMIALFMLWRAWDNYDLIVIKKTPQVGPVSF